MTANVEKVTELLADKNLDINAYDSAGYTALGRIIEAPKSEEACAIAEMLLQHPNIDPEKAVQDGDNALFLAVHHKIPCIVFLLRSDPRVNINYKSRKSEFCTPLLAALKNADTEYLAVWEEAIAIVKDLLMHDKINVNISCKQKVPFLLAVKHTNAPTIKAFLKHQIWDKNVKDENGEGVLHFAIKSSKGIKMIRHLLNDKDINKNMTDKDGNTVLHLALKRLRYAYSDILKSLFGDHRLSLNIRNHKNELPYHAALKTILNDPSFEFKMLELILESFKERTDFLAHQAEDLDGNTVLHILVHLFVAHRDYSGTFAKSLSARHIFEIFNIFRKAQFDFNSRNNKDQTILHIALDSPNSPIQDEILSGILSSEGVDPSLVDQNGFTPLQLARKYGDNELAKTFFKISDHENFIYQLLDQDIPAESSEDKRFYDGYLNIAISRGWTKVIQKLLADEKYGYTKSFLSNNRFFLSKAIKSQNFSCFQLIWPYYEDFITMEDEYYLSRCLSNCENQNIFEVFEQKGLKIYGPDENSKEKLHLAAANGWIEFLEKNDNNIGVNITYNGKTLLHMAFGQKDPVKQSSVVQFLLNEPKKINVCALLEEKNLQLSDIINESSGLVLKEVSNCYLSIWKRSNSVERAALALDIELLRLEVFSRRPLQFQEFQTVYSQIAIDHSILDQHASTRQNNFGKALMENYDMNNIIKVYFDRKDLLASAMLQLRRIEAAGKDLSRRRLYAKFVGENGEDGGALSHEVYPLLFDILCNLSHLFVWVGTDDKYLNIAPLEEAKITEEMIDNYRLFGKLLGLALRSQTPPGVRISTVLLRQLLGLPETWLDIREVDPKQYENLMVHFM